MMQLRPDNGRKRWRPRFLEPKPAETLQWRFMLLRALILLLFGVLLVQLAHMQIVDHDSYQTRAEVNRLRVVPQLASRGLVYDRNGEQLVENKPIFSAAVVPADVPDEQIYSVVAELSRLAGVSGQELGSRIREAQESKDPFTPLIVKEDLDQETAFRLRESQPDFPGVQVLVESVRRYPNGPLASLFVGYVGRIDAEEYEELRDRGYQLNDRLGKTGVELTYESVLRGSPGYRQVEIDAAGQEIRTLRSVEPQPAGNLVLSLDLDLQRKVTELLQAAMGAGGSRNAAAIVMDIHTGEILSMVSLPSYDNNILTDPADQERLPALLNDPAKPMVNHAIAEVYPPGSTFKQVTGTAALQEGVATPATTIFSGGSITIPNEWGGEPQVMMDWKYHGWMNFYQGLAWSSDVYFYYLAGGFEDFQGLGATRLARYAREYGFGSPTGIDLPGEAAGLVPDPEWKEQALDGEVWTLGDTYNFGIGQGYLAVTPLQLLRVIAAIANGGDVLVPHVVREIVDGDGNTLQVIERQVANKLPISQENLAVMREALGQAADYGPAKTGASSLVTIGAKTGTAEFGQQLPDGTYTTSHAWYTAYAPFDEPEIALVVFLEKGIGATHSGPVAKQILDYYFGRRYQVQEEGAP